MRRAAARALPPRRARRPAGCGPRRRRRPRPPKPRRGRRRGGDARHRRVGGDDAVHVGRDALRGAREQDGGLVGARRGLETTQVAAEQQREHAERARLEDLRRGEQAGAWHLSPTPSPRAMRQGRWTAIALGWLSIFGIHNRYRAELQMIDSADTGTGTHN